MDIEPFLTPITRNDMMAHMLAEHPREACGMITLSSEGYTYVSLTNVSDTPDRKFELSREDSARIQMDPTVVAYVHSHPTGPGYPSKRDMEIQKLIGKPSVIVALDPPSGVVDVFSCGDHLLDLPLDGRVFRHCVTDCYEAIRSWRWQNEGVKMDAFARKVGWWNRDEAVDYDAEDMNMYERHYQSQGYVSFVVDYKDPTSPFHPMIGDLVLMQLGGDLGVINHAGIYVGNNLIYDHRMGKKSGNKPIGHMIGTGMLRGWARQEDKL